MRSFRTIKHVYLLNGLFKQYLIDGGINGESSNYYVVILPQ